jgi:hypothetical protein
MAFSQTVSATVFNTDRLVTTAARRCRLNSAQLTAEHWDIARNNLYLTLSDLANRGIPLWCITKIIMPLYEGVGDLTLPLGVVDVLNQNLRVLQEVTGTNTDTATSRTVEFSSAAHVSTAGVKWNATSVPIALERSDDGVTWTTVQSETPQAVTGEWSWYDLQSVVDALYFRVRATSGTLAFSDIYLGNNPNETPMARLNRDQYSALPDKTFKNNRPLQFWFDRTVRYPVMHLWPIPNATAESYQVVAWVHRQIMDVGTLTQEVEVPQRWYEAIVCQLARKMAREIAEVNPAVIPLLDNDAATALAYAQAEERDNSPMTIIPNISAYTR